MCTAVSYLTKDFYFGRNLDLEYSYLEEVAVVPRNFPFVFRRAKEMKRHFAMIGMAYIQEGFPLFYDAVNEKGLGLAGLNFPGNAHYEAEKQGRENIAPFELIPRVLGSCATLKEARAFLESVHLAAIPFSDKLPLTPLHFFLADRSGSLIIEPTAEGLKLYEDPYGVMTNNPPFPAMEAMIANYMQLTAEEPVNRFGAPLKAYSRGMGSMGLPGDMSSASRFIKAAFVRNNSVAEEGELGSVNQFFHILTSVEQPRGCVKWGGKYEYTIYSSCCNGDKGIYYYTTYENRTIHGVDMRALDLESDRLFRFPLKRGELSLQNEPCGT